MPSSTPPVCETADGDHRSWTKTGIAYHRSELGSAGVVGRTSAGTSHGADGSVEDSGRVGGGWLFDGRGKQDLCAGRVVLLSPCEWMLVCGFWPRWRCELHVHV